MKNPFLISVYLIILSMCFLSCDKDDDNTPAPQGVVTPAELTETLNEVLEESAAPGVAVSITKNDLLTTMDASIDQDAAA